MRNGRIFEIETKGRDIGQLKSSLEEKGMILLEKEKAIANAVDISTVEDYIGYIKWINQKRPKTYIVDGQVFELKPREIYGKKVLDVIAKKKESETKRINPVRLPYKE